MSGDRFGEISDELRGELELALRQAKANEGKSYTMVGPREFSVVRDKGVVVVRQRDSLGRRHSMFCELSTSKGIDAVEFAKDIAMAFSTLQKIAVNGHFGAQWLVANAEVALGIRPASDEAGATK